MAPSCIATYRSRSRLKSGACSKIEHDGGTVCCLARVGGTGGAPGRFMVIVFSPPALPTTRMFGNADTLSRHPPPPVINIVEGDFLRCPVFADCISSRRSAPLCQNTALYSSRQTGGRHHNITLPYTNIVSSRTPHKGWTLPITKGRFGLKLSSPHHTITT